MEILSRKHNRENNDNCDTSTKTEIKTTFPPPKKTNFNTYQSCLKGFPIQTNGSPKKQQRKHNAS